MIEFTELEIPGTHQSPQVGPPRFVVERTKFPAVKGESEVQFGVGGRQIVIPITLHSKNFTTAKSVTDAIEQFDEKIGTNGELKITGLVERKFPNCTFDGFFPNGSPLPDVGSTLNESPSPGQTYYFVEGVLVWYQLSTEETL